VLRSRIIALLLLTTVLGGYAAAGTEARKIKTRVEPTYPELARQSRIEGTVRVEVVIAANGEVKSTKPLGGHPLLLQSAERAIRQWRYDPGPETTAIIEFHFHVD
jgi:TonB family protein